MSLKEKVLIENKPIDEINEIEGIPLKRIDNSELNPYLLETFLHYKIDEYIQRGGEIPNDFYIVKGKEFDIICEFENKIDYNNDSVKSLKLIVMINNIFKENMSNPNYQIEQNEDSNQAIDNIMELEALIDQDLHNLGYTIINSKNEEELNNYPLYKGIYSNIEFKKKDDVFVQEFRFSGYNKLFMTRIDFQDKKFTY